MIWLDLLDGCDLLGKLNERGDAYTTIKGSLVEELVGHKRYSQAVAEKLVDDIIKERKRSG